MVSLFIFGAMFLSPILATILAIATRQWWLLLAWPIWALAILDDFLIIGGRK